MKLKASYKGERIDFEQVPMIYHRPRDMDELPEDMLLTWVQKILVQVREALHPGQTVFFRREVLIYRSKWPPTAGDYVDKPLLSDYGRDKLVKYGCQKHPDGQWRWHRLQSVDTDKVFGENGDDAACLN